MIEGVAGHPGWPRDLLRALGTAGRTGLFQRLAGIYQGLPATTCERRGDCCGLLPPLQPIEMLAWLARRPGEDQAWADDAAALVEHFLLNAHQRRPCPWARPGTCADYESRFLACRAHGLWSETVYDQRRRAALDRQAAVAAAWAGLGVRLPDEVLAQKSHYCRQVRLCNAGVKYPSLDEALLAAESALEQMAQSLSWRGELAACGGDLSYLAARLALGDRECLALKVQATKAGLASRAGLAGREAELAGILAAARERARAWAAARSPGPGD